MPDNLLEPEFSEPFTMWQNDPSPMNSQNLLKAVNPVLTSALRQYGTQSSPTLHSRAKIMAIGAMKRYDPSQAKLRTYLISQLQGLRRYAAKETQILSVPEQVALDIHHLRNTENELRDSLGRDPSDAELSDHLRLPIKRISYIRKAAPSYSESFFHKDTGGEGDDLYSPAVRQDNSALTQWHEFVYNDLAPMDQLVLEHTLGLHGKRMLNNTELARRLRISPGAVSQRKARIQAKLDLRDELKVI